MDKTENERNMKDFRLMFYNKNKRMNKSATEKGSTGNNGT